MNPVSLRVKSLARDNIKLIKNKTKNVLFINKIIFMYTPWDNFDTTSRPFLKR